MPEVLSPDQIASYNENGYLVLENRIPAEWINRIRDEIHRFETEAATMTASNDRLDLEDSHSAETPRLRRTLRIIIWSAIWRRSAVTSA